MPDRYTNPVPSTRIAYNNGTDPREVAAEWINDACREIDNSDQRTRNALIGIGMALLALTDELRATAVDNA